MFMLDVYSELFRQLSELSLQESIALGLGVNYFAAEAGSLMARRKLLAAAVTTGEDVAGEAYMVIKHNLSPDDGILRYTNMLPITRLFNYGVARMLKGKKVGETPVLDLI